MENRAQALFRSLEIGLLVHLLLPAMVVVGALEESSAAPSPGPTPSISPTPSPTPTRALSEQDKKAILSRFKSALASEEGALQHQHEMERKAMVQAQSARKKEFLTEGRRKQLEVFKNDQDGKRRREFQQEALRRRRMFFAILKDEMKLKNQQQRSEMNSLQELNRLRIRQFESHLKKGQYPPQDLWP